jgi:hypothetical protein
VQAGLEADVEPGLDQGQPLLAQALPVELGAGPRDPGQGLVAVPQLKRLAVQRVRPGEVPGRRALLGLRGEAFGLVGVDLVVLAEPERVAARLADQCLRARAERLPQPGGVGAQRRDGVVGRLLAPQHVDQLVGGGRPAPAQGQGGEHGVLLWCALGQELVAQPRLDRAEHR